MHSEERTIENIQNKELRKTSGTPNRIMWVR
jgi:hypothetical protein